MKKYVAAALLPALLLCGCSVLPPPREADQLLVVQTLGWDEDETGQTVSLSVPREETQGGPVRLTGRGTSLLTALRSAQETAPREELFYPHIRFVAVGEEAARRGMQPLLDAMERSPRTRLDLPLVVVRGDTARALVTGSEDEDYEITSLLASLVREAEKEGAVRFATVLETARSLAEDGAALCCALELTRPEDEAPSSDGAVAPRPAGCAVLRRGRLTGYLTAEAAEGVDLFRGNAEGLTLALGEEDAASAVRLRRSRVKITALFDADAVPLLRISLSVRGALAEQDGAADDGEIDERLSRALLERVGAALAASRELETDFLRLERLWDPEELRRAGIGSAEELLRALRWQIQVRSELERPYDLRQPAPVEGRGGAP